MRWLREARRGSEPKGDFHPLTHCERSRLAKEETMEPRETIDETVAAGAVEAREMVAPPTRAKVRPAQGAAPCPPCSGGAAAATAGASYVYVLSRSVTLARLSKKKWLRQPGVRKQL